MNFKLVEIDQFRNGKQNSSSAQINKSAPTIGVALSE